MELHHQPPDPEPGALRIELRGYCPINGGSQRSCPPSTRGRRSVFKTVPVCLPGLTSEKNGAASRIRTGVCLFTRQVHHCSAKAARNWSARPVSHRVRAGLQSAASTTSASRAFGNGEANGNRTRTTAFTEPDAYSYIMTSIGSAFTDEKWCSRMDLHHELPPSQSGVHLLHFGSEIESAVVSPAGGARCLSARALLSPASQRRMLLNWSAMPDLPRRCLTGSQTCCCYTNGAHAAAIGGQTRKVTRCDANASRRERTFLLLLQPRTKERVSCLGLWRLPESNCL
jgi:hypothetical protein